MRERLERLCYVRALGHGLSSESRIAAWLLRRPLRVLNAAIRDLVGQCCDSDNEQAEDDAMREVEGTEDN